MDTMPTAKKTKSVNVRAIAQIGVLSAMAAALMMLEVPLPFLPPFYKLDFGEIPALIGGFAMGPMAAVAIEFFKVLLHLIFMGTSTAGVGDLANFIIGCALVVPAAFFYRRRKSRRMALAGLSAGTVVMTLVGALMNAFVLLPVYAAAFHMPMDALIGMGSQVNPAINNLTTFVLLATTPLNLIKCVSVSVLTILLYKKVSPLLHGKM